MNENFEKIKRRYRLDAYLKSALISLSAGAFIFGAMLLVFKLFDIDFPIIYHVLISVGAFAIGLATCLLLFLKSDIKIARMLDNEFSLAERVETMVRFRHGTSDMLTLQRENTNEILSTLPTKKPVVIRFLSSAIACVLALGMLIPSLLIPKRVTPPYVEPFLFSEWDEEFMNDLKENIEERGLDADVKSFMLDELDSLHNELKAATTKDNMYSLVVSSIVEIDIYVDALSSFKRICVPIDKNDNADLKQIARAIFNLNGIAFGEKLDDLKENYEGDTIIPAESEGGTPTVVTLNEKLTALGEGLKTALEALPDEAEDTLYIPLLAFASAIEGAAAEADATAKAQKVDEAFAEASASVGKVLSSQYTTRAARSYINTSLIRNFGVPDHLIPPLLSDILPTLSTSAASGEAGESNDESASGGYGEGNELFGVSGVIYHPFGEDGAQYVVLDPDTLDSYYERVEDILRDDSISLQIKQILTDYYRKLSDGTNPAE